MRRLIAERRITYVKVGRLVRFEEGAVVAYIDPHRVVPINRAEIGGTVRSPQRWTDQIAKQSGKNAAKGKKAGGRKKKDERSEG